MNEHLQRYAAFFEELDVDRLDELSSVMTEDIHFVDPFNNVSGIAQVEKIFADMFENLGNPRFTISHMALAPPAEESDATLGFLRWEFNCILRGKPYQVIGMSEVRFAKDGRVNHHVDHWDAAQQFYERLPLIGALLRIIRSRLKI